MTPADRAPFAYFITYHTYGTWLHGTERGSVDRRRSIPGTPVLDPNQRRDDYAPEVYRRAV